MLTQTIAKTSLEVISYGEMPTEPMQVGQWWVVPAEQYHSTSAGDAKG